MLNNQVKQLSNDFEKAWEDKIILQKKVTELNAELQKISHKNSLEWSDLNEKIRKLKSEGKTSEEGMESLKAKFELATASALTEKNNAQGEIQNMKTDLQRNTNDLWELQGMLERKELEITSLKAQIDGLKEQLQESQDSVNQLIREKSKLSKKVDRLKDNSSVQQYLGKLVWLIFFTHSLCFHWTV